MDINFTDLNMFDSTGNLDIGHIFINSWFFGVADIGFLVILFASALLLSRANFNFGQITSVIFAMALGFATASSIFTGTGGSAVMWGIVILILIITGLRMLQAILLRI